MTDHVSVQQKGENVVNEPANGTKSQITPRSRRQSQVQRLAPADLPREEAIRRLVLLHRLVRVSAESNHDVGKFLQGVAHLCSEQIGDMCTITMLNMRGQTYHVAAYDDPDPEIVALFRESLLEIDQIHVSQGWVASVIATGEAVLVPAIAIDAANQTAVPAFREFASRAGVASMLIVPIMGRSGVLGTLAMTRHTRGRPYTEDNQALLLELGQRVGLEVEGGVLIDSLRHEVAGRQFALDALVASEQRFLSIFHAASMGIQIMSPVGNVLESNPAFQAMTGYSEEELIAMQFHDLVHADDLEAVLNAFQQVRSGRQNALRLDLRLCARDGSVCWTRTTFAGVKEKGGRRSLSLIFAIMEDITAQKRADAELMELRQHLQRSIEGERLKLAQNLHDIPLQELYAVIYRLEELRLTTRPATSEIIGQVIGDIKRTLDGLRSTASDLRPPALSRFGLEKAIRSYAEDFRIKHPDIDLTLAVAQDQEFLAEDTRLVLFRVFQEAMANIVRHACSSAVQVRFSFDAEEARIEVTDNGRGFAVPDNWMVSAREGHYGLAGMAERVGAAGGVLALDSHPGGPTTVRAVVPC
ncbi:MAG TPA: PAS domain S-box protein [Anaerolineales bacterium]|nr:PAS domain S-box protein [Anaerolineales bacterium]